MNLIKTLSCTCALVLSQAALADVTIQVPDTIDLLVANGETPELSGGFFSSGKTLTLPDGVNQIAFRYTVNFDKSNDRITVESDTVIAKFNAQDKELTFNVPRYRNEREAKSQIKALDWTLVDKSGQAVEMLEDKLMKEGMQIGRDYQREVEDYNRAGGIAAVAVAGAVMPVTLPAQLPESSASSDTAEEMLHFWYDKADEETKARFKAHINQ
ncbi:DUF2057 family protein [Vibrio sp. 10N.261.55.A7]|uniref:DUF2057 family protein n=1 Tax=Vibrio sp. 10N.261.55.A7 TaxID=1880851 RepID=UPI000C85925B|nr:DUF2057 family protein [Vibrio sp. 10N.261.55.A7]PMJ92939.1 hypothetical protein BCU12_06415 [Vibrio sp. 10N.261.55.A7]